MQVHGEINLDINKQIEYLKKLENYSNYLGFPIIFTLHTIYDDDKNISINKTIDYITNLNSNINTKKIVISLENLNDIRGYIRLSKEDIKPIVLNDEKIFFTYDIGHEISNYRSIINIDGYMFDNIRNVHLHSVNADLKDHIPIYKNDKNFYEYACDYLKNEKDAIELYEYLKSAEQNLNELEQKDDVCR